jgi:hypothetical protein
MPGSWPSTRKVSLSPLYLVRSTTVTFKGTASNPPRGYVIFTAATPISLNGQRVWRVLDRQPQTTNASTTVAYLEFGKPGANHAALASHMKAAILDAADLCKVQLAAK